MEFHNVKLLPRGLPEIIAQLVPYDIYPDTKVIVYPRKGMGPPKMRYNALGYAGYDSLTFSFHIGLYPTMCCSNGGHTLDYPGTQSFQLWMGMLSTAIHEIGHLATRQLYYNLPRDDEHYWETRCYVESLANDWMECTMARILRADPRLGQPLGALTGYPGILAYKMRSSGGKPWDGFNPHRIADWRALSCGGQITINDIAEKLMLQEHLGYEVSPEGWEKAKARCRRAVHKAAKELGIEHYFINKNGRRYLMFNAGEAEAVYEWLLNNGAKLIDSNGGLVGIDSPERVPLEQMGLPF